MDAFEQLVADIFWAEGYWVRNSFKVSLSKAEKAAIDRPSSPRWEIDLIAYRPADCCILALECKSYFDSGGVHSAHFEDGSKYAHKYKLFHDDNLRAVVLNRARLQLIDSGLCDPQTEIKLGLVYGYATPGNAGRVRAKFERQAWELYDPSWLLARLRKASKGSYENSIATVVSKLFLQETQHIGQLPPTSGNLPDDDPYSEAAEEREESFVDQLYAGEHPEMFDPKQQY